MRKEKERILIVDDLKTNTKMLARLLSKYECETANSGPEALAKMDAFLPDIILLDVVMPGMDGLQVCEAIKNSPKHKDLPVIMVTALDDHASKISSLKTGASEFLTKPIDPIELRLRVTNLLKVKEYGDFLVKHNAVLQEQLMERQKAEAKILAGQARYHALMDQSFEALALIDIQTQEVVEVNRRFTELLGYSLPEDAPLYVSRFVENSTSSLDKFFAAIRSGQRVVQPEARIFRNKSGSEVPVERAGTVISVEGRELYLASMRDMTEERRRQAEMSRNVEIARRVQRELLPELPPSPCVDVRTLYHPVLFVSGDSYQFEWRDGGKVLRGFLIDVSGHGIATALQAASVGVLLREASVAQQPLLEGVQWVNERVSKYFIGGSYATLLGFELDLSGQELRYVGAGITKFYHNGKAVKSPGMIVGMFAGAIFDTGVISLSEGDCLHFLTDGFTDALAQPENIDFWSPDGKAFEADVASLKSLAESGALQDDATGVCLKIKKFWTTEL